MAIYLGIQKIAGLGGSGSANVVYLSSLEEYNQMEHDPATIYVTPAHISNPEQLGINYWQILSGNVDSLINTKTAPITTSISSLSSTSDYNDNTLNNDLKTYTDGKIKSLSGAADYRDQQLSNDLKTYTNTQIASATFPSNKITAMTGYLTGNLSTAISAGDTLNKAIGKLECKSNTMLQMLAAFSGMKTITAKDSSNRQVHCSYMELTNECMFVIAYTDPAQTAATHTDNIYITIKCKDGSSTTAQYLIEPIFNRTSGSDLKFGSTSKVNHSITFANSGGNLAVWCGILMSKNGFDITKYPVS